MATYQNIFTRVQIHGAPDLGVPIPSRGTRRGTATRVVHLFGMFGDAQVGPIYLGWTVVTSIVREQLVNSKQTVTVETGERTASTNTSERATSAEPGAASNVPRALQLAQGPARTSSNEESENSSRVVPSFTVTEKEFLTAMPKAVPPSCVFIDRAAWLTVCLSRPVITTCAPRSANPWAIARPMPRVPPETRTIWSFTENSGSSISMFLAASKRTGNGSLILSAHSAPTSWGLGSFRWWRVLGAERPANDAH